MKKRIVLVILSVLLLIGTVGMLSVSAEDAAPVATSAQDAPSLKFYGATLVLNNTIEIRYYADVENVTNINDIKMLVWDKHPDAYTKGTEKYVVEYEGKYQTFSNKNYYCFDFKNGGVKRMVDDFYAVLYIKTAQGEYYSSPAKYSVLNYAYSKLGKTGTATTDINLKNLLDSILVYGAMSQMYTNYKTDRLATDDFYQVRVSGGKISDGFSNGLYLEGDSVTINAPEIDSNGEGFVYWKNSSGAVVSTEKDYTFAVGANNEIYTSVYECVHQGAWVTVTPATCRAAGLEKRTCTICSAVSEREIPVNPDAHNMDKWKVTFSATCTMAGVEESVCLNGCGKTLTNTIAATGHNVSNEYTYNAIEHWHKCTNSGCTYVEDKEAHTFGSVSCTECGTSKWGSIGGNLDTPVIPFG